mmetsp:Transcript_17498/g.26224  ORF Transcript_17498/g.26224 Transcript_17498/m.26224 type:complete len:87 (-) Transcript_17498:188-448(-)
MFLAWIFIGLCFASPSVIPFEAQKLLNDYMKYNLRLGDLEKYISLREKYLTEMEEAQDIWETSDGAWIPRVVLGTTSYQLDERLNV